MYKFGIAIINPAGRKADRQTGALTDGWADKQMDRQIDR